MPLVQTRGAASAQGFGEFSQSGPVNYIEEVFSTYLWDGNATARNIVNGIDLATKGGMVWTKYRNTTNSHRLYDTARGATKQIFSDLTNAEQTAAQSLTSFNTDGFSLGTGQPNENTATVVGWTFREQPKFFDIVTFTSSAGPQTISHNLGATPGMMIVKCATVSDDWYVWHRSIPNNALALNTTQSTSTYNNPEFIFGNGTVVVQPTSTQFTFYAGNSGSNTYVAYLFAHDAGGFGLTGSDNVISCGTFNNAVASEITLGWEPQWLLVKSSSAASNWHIIDTMRGMSNTGQNLLAPNLTNAEIAQQQYFIPTATGFTQNPFFGNTTIYMAIRRGPMKVPTTGTSVFVPSTYTGNGNSDRTISSLTSPVDLVIMNSRNSSSPNRIFTDRLRGSGTGENSGNMRTLTSTTTVEESNSSLNGYYATLDFQTSVKMIGSSSGIYNGGSTGYVLYAFQRAPSFFDEVCFTGTSPGSGSFAITHNLGVAPELIIFRQRNGTSTWQAGTNFTSTTWRSMFLNNTNAGSQDPYANADWFGAQPTATTFTVGFPYYTTGKWVAWLFATCPGVSKVGSYTGTGTTQTINCGFTAGSRFIMIKRTDSTGDWYVWDSARGIVAGNDPYLLLNSTAAEVTNTDYVDTDNSGFEISSTAPAAINANGGTYIFLAIA